MHATPHISRSKLANPRQCYIPVEHGGLEARAQDRTVKAKSSYLRGFFLNAPRSANRRPGCFRASAPRKSPARRTARLRLPGTRRRG